MSGAMKHYSTSSTEQNTFISEDEEVDVGEKPSVGTCECSCLFEEFPTAGREL